MGRDNADARGLSVTEDAEVADVGNDKQMRRRSGYEPGIPIFRRGHEHRSQACVC